MVMLAENYQYVIGGDPDRDTIDLAVLDTATGRVRGHLADAADGAGYRRMLAWAAENAPGRRVWALEGTGSFAAGLFVFLVDAGETVVEVGALKRARGAKNDRIDAIRAARQALSRDEQGAPRSGGLREALRMVFACREGVLVSRTKAINELKSLIVVAPEQLRAPLRGRSLITQPRGHRATASGDDSAGRTPPVGAQSAIDRGTDSVPVRPTRRTRPPAARPHQATPRRAGPARRVWSRPRRGRATADQLVPPRAGPQRGSVCITGRSRSAGDQQWTTLPAPPQPRR
jgi:Transposase